MQGDNEKKLKRPDDRKGTTRKNIRFEDNLLQQIDDARAQSGASFSEWVKGACRQKIDNNKS